MHVRAADGEDSWQRMLVQVRPVQTHTYTIHTYTVCILQGGGARLQLEKSVSSSPQAAPGARAFPFDTGHLPLNDNGNPGVNGVSYRG